MKLDDGASGDHCNVLEERETRVERREEDVKVVPRFGTETCGELD